MGSIDQRWLGESQAVEGEHVRVSVGGTKACLAVGGVDLV